jgi:hypothetical protein
LRRAAGLNHESCHIERCGVIAARAAIRFDLGSSRARFSQVMVKRAMLPLANRW